MPAEDDDIQWDPATFPDNLSLMASLDDIARRAEQRKARQKMLAERFAEALHPAAAEVEKRMLARNGKRVVEEDLRGGIAEALRERGELVLTEARMAVPGWTSNLGGFDLAIVDNGSLVPGETKWADGNLHECMWDILKLASATTIARVDAGVAFYAAPVQHWLKPGTCAQLFEDRFVTGRDLIWAFPDRWRVNLAGSTAVPHAVPTQINLRVVTTEQIDLLGKAWEIRALSVLGDQPSYTLENGWPHGAPPAEPTPLQ